MYFIWLSVCRQNTIFIFGLASPCGNHMLLRHVLCISSGNNCAGWHVAKVKFVPSKENSLHLDGYDLAIKGEALFHIN